LSNSYSQVSCRVIVFFSLLALAGCGGSSGGGNFQQQTVVAISGAPPSAIGVGANWQYTATVNGVASQAVNWTISPASAGTIDSGTGLYIAPLTVPSPATVTITATSQADSTQSASASVTVQATDPLGKVAAESPLSACLGDATLSATAACYQLTVSCPGVADITTYLKVNNPSAVPKGTVLFGVGTGGSGLYDDGNTYQYGSQVVENVLTYGFNTVQVSFGGPFSPPTPQPNGWLQGPGGVRRLACRYATVADWVYKNPATINQNPNNTAINSAPMCATGNSGGSGAIGYAVYEYGLNTELAMIEPTSGPVMARVDQGCSPTCLALQGPVCGNSSNSSSMCYESADASVIDEAYQAANATTPTPCTDSLNGNAGTDAASLFLSDSIIYSPGTSINLPNTTVSMVFGDLDTSNAVPEGMVWEEAIVPSSASPSPLNTCLPNVLHDIPSYFAGATQIANDIINLCQ
jgi:hypothetical protein